MGRSTISPVEGGLVKTGCGSQTIAAAGHLSAGWVKNMTALGGYTHIISCMLMGVCLSMK